MSRIPATPKHRARLIEERGLPKSPVLSGLLLAFAICLVVRRCGDAIAAMGVDALETALRSACSMPSPDVRLQSWEPIGPRALTGIVLVAGILISAGILLQWLQGGITWRPKAIGPDWERLSWHGGCRRLIREGRGLQLCLSLLAFTLIFGTAVTFLCLRPGTLPAMPHVDGTERPFADIGAISQWLLDGLEWVLLAAVAVAALELWLRRRRFFASIDFTPEQWREELKRLQPNADIRRVQRLRTHRRHESPGSVGHAAADSRQ